MSKFVYTVVDALRDYYAHQSCKSWCFGQSHKGRDKHWFFLLLVSLRIFILNARIIYVLICLIEQSAHSKVAGGRINQSYMSRLSESDRKFSNCMITIQSLTPHETTSPYGPIDVVVLEKGGLRIFFFTTNINFE